MVFEIVNNVLLICLIIINYRIIKKLNIILVKPKSLAPIEDIMSCDNCDSCDIYNNKNNYNYDIYKFVEKKDAMNVLNKGPPKLIHPSPSLPDPIKSQISTLQLTQLSHTEKLTNCEEQKYMQDTVNYDNVNYDKDKLLETEEKKEEKESIVSALRRAALHFNPLPEAGAKSEDTFKSARLNCDHVRVQNISPRRVCHRPSHESRVSREREGGG